MDKSYIIHTFRRKGKTAQRYNGATELVDVETERRRDEETRKKTLKVMTLISVSGKSIDYSEVISVYGKSYCIDQ